MKTQLKLATTPAERSAARRLRAVIRRYNLQYYGSDPDGDEDPEMDGHTLCAFDKRQLVGSIDVHLGVDAIDEDKLAHFRVGDTLDLSLVIDEVVVLDEPMVHPEFREDPVDLELKEGAARFALRRGGRYVFSACEHTDLPVHESIGFKPTGWPGSLRMKSQLLPILLDLADLENLRRHDSPLLREATRIFGGERAPGPMPQPQPKPIGGARSAPSIRKKRQVERESSPESVRESGDQELDHSAVWRQIFALRREARKANAGLLSTIEKSEIGQLLLGSHILQPKRGDKIIREGERGRQLFLVLTGALAVHSDGMVVAVLTAGDVAGEIGFLLESERTSDVVAYDDDVRVLCINADHLDEIMSKDAELAAKVSVGIAKALCRKLINMNR